MKIYQTKTKRLTGTDFKEVRAQAFIYYKEIKKRTKRRPYVRSAYFNKDKIFIDLFWQHLFAKYNWRDRVRRIIYFPAALELLQKSKFNPVSKENRHNSEYILHRFTGTTADKHLFYVQVKQHKKSGKLFLISTFPD